MRSNIPGFGSKWEGRSSSGLRYAEVIRYNDPEKTILDGGIALLCEEGLIMTDEVSVTGA